MKAASEPALDGLFDADFLESVQHLRVIARRVAPRGRFAEQRSRDRGHGLEFQDYRPYVAGDDLRAIDWTVYRRLGRVFLRLFEELEDLPVYLLPDVSRSLWLEDPPRVRAGLQCALALGAISLGHHDSVGLFPFSDDVATLLRPQAGKARLYNLADRLTEVERGGVTDLRRSLSRFGALGLREGLAVVISDFFDPGGLAAVTEALRGVRHRLLLVQLVRGTDRTPAAMDGDLRLVDCETAEVQDVSVTPAVLERYRDAYDRFADGLQSFARSRGAGLLAVDVERQIVPQLAELFEQGRFTV
ncbi:DUF58 domain-containing protein [Engelhardtia mirabilis]|uniref:DUF58 domain-containing protein n=1 Tax=Engelhardtia mirabilis TaxID=2528011 RepID=A0A518BGN7_9BACT|nr:hypothetical protein Pla133_11960 [Planctomycetes bacterium Pla133]QDV00457.1 hypothetical protein Pla86_11960 [Planctomycetes bacterium Pla86]